MEIATGWTTFANGGYKIEPYLIQRIEDREGNLLFEANPARVPPRETQTADVEVHPVQSNPVIADGEQMPAAPRFAEQVLDERTAYIMTSMLQDVIKRGTGRRALALGRDDIAGKTGTTNDSIDSWFSGYNADLVTTVWAGFDQPQSLGRNRVWRNGRAADLDELHGRRAQDMPEHPPAEPDGLLSCGSILSAAGLPRLAHPMRTSKCSRAKTHHRRWASSILATRRRAARCPLTKPRHSICSDPEADFAAKTPPRRGFSFKRISR